MNVTIVAGARPNFMKIAPIIRAIDQYNQANKTPINFRLVHTGQHYDDKLSRVFFNELELPDPHVNLEVGSGTQAEQTARIMVAFERDILAYPTDLVVVVGDVTSTMACTIAAKKLHTKVAHVEGGIRSYDMTMPEEINRMVTDSIADYFFTTSKVANENLERGGVGRDRIFFVGNTMIDSLTFSLPKLKKPLVWNMLNLADKQFLVLTLHRPSNVDDENTLKSLLSEIEKYGNGLTVIFPVHPRTRKNFDRISSGFKSVKGIEPLSYFEFVYLLQHAKGVITDSGGVQEETTVLKIPCITLRTSTERPETVSMGTNLLVGNDFGNLGKAMTMMMNDDWKEGQVPELWDGRTAERIVSIFADLLKRNNQD